MSHAASLGVPVSARSPSRWLLGRRTAVQLAAIVALAIIGLTLSIIVASRTWEARAWVRHTREVQLQIDRIVWDMLSLQQSMQAYKLTKDPAEALRFGQMRTAIRNDINWLETLTDDNNHQQQLIDDFEAVFAPYVAKLEYLFSIGETIEADLTQAQSTVASAANLSDFIKQMRDHEDGLLVERAARAENLLLTLLPTLALSAALIALLVMKVAQSINLTIHDRDHALAAKTGELAVKDMLVREVDHRARNSLGLIYNLMTFQQQRQGNSDETREFLAEAANQVLVVARMHERLYKAGDAKTVALASYLRDLCDDVAAYSLTDNQRAAIVTRVSDVSVPAEKAIWLGLIVVELVTNAVKHGHASVQAPITVDVGADDGSLRLKVSDSGPGLSPDFEPQASKGLGMQVVGLLARQLRGTLAVDRATPGAHFVVMVPLTAA